MVKAIHFSNLSLYFLSLIFSAPEHSLSASEARASSSRDQSPPLMDSGVNEVLLEDECSHAELMVQGGVPYYSDMEESSEDERETGMDITPPPDREFEEVRRRKMSVFKSKVASMG